MKKPVLLLLLGAISVATQAQRIITPEYIVTSAGDTLRGTVTIRGNSQAPVLRLHRRGQQDVNLAATEVHSYGDALSTFLVNTPVGPHGQRQLLVPLTRGSLRLYSGRSANGEKRFFLQPQDSAYAIAVSPTVPRLDYLRLLPGCPELNFADSHLEREYGYNQTGLTRLVQKYTTCRYGQAATVVPYTDGSQTRFGATAGLFSTRFNFEDQSVRLGEATNQPNYFAGLTMNVSTRRHWSLQGEALYLFVRREYAPVSVYNGGATYTTTRALNIRYNQVQLPLLARYTLGRGAARPYLTAGVLYCLNVNQRSEVLLQDSDKPSPQRTAFEAVTSNTGGGTAGAGLLFSRPKGPAFSLEARYDYLQDSAIEQHTTRLSAGIIF